MHGTLELWLCKVSEFPRPVREKLICSLGPGFSEEEEEAFDILWHWMKFGRGLCVNVYWILPEHSEKKRLSNDQKFMRSQTRWKNIIMKKFPLFWEEIFLDKQKELKRRYDEN